MDMGNSRKIGWAIDQLRLRRGLAKKTLAIETGIDAANLNRIISGKQWPTPERLEALAEFFGIPVWEMFRIAEQGALPANKEEDPRKGRLKDFVDQLDADQLDILFRRQTYAVSEPSRDEAADLAPPKKHRK